MANKQHTSRPPTRSASTLALLATISGLACGDTLVPVTPDPSAIAVELSASTDTVDPGAPYSAMLVMVNTSDHVLRLESRRPHLAVPRVERVAESGVRIDMSPGYFCPGITQTHWFGPGERQVIQWDFEASLLDGESLSPGHYRVFAQPHVDGLAGAQIDFYVR